MGQEKCLRQRPIDGKNGTANISGGRALMLPIQNFGFESNSPPHPLPFLTPPIQTIINFILSDYRVYPFLNRYLLYPINLYSTSFPQGKKPLKKISTKDIYTYLNRTVFFIWLSKYANGGREGGGGSWGKSSGNGWMRWYIKAEIDTYAWIEWVFSGKMLKIKWMDESRKWIWRESGWKLVWSVSRLMNAKGTAIWPFWIFSFWINVF